MRLAIRNCESSVVCVLCVRVWIYVATLIPTTTPFEGTPFDIHENAIKIKIKIKKQHQNPGINMEGEPQPMSHHNNVFVVAIEPLYVMSARNSTGYHAVHMWLFLYYFHTITNSLDDSQKSAAVQNSISASSVVRLWHCNRHKHVSPLL